MVIKLNEQGNPTGFPLLEDNFKQIISDVTFPAVLYPYHVEPHGYGMYEFTQQPTLTGRYDKLVEGEPIRDEQGYWRQQWLVVEQTAEEKAETDKRKAGETRFKRNQRLAATDWTRLDDAPLTTEQRAAYAVYRQQLRDLTNQPGFPWEIPWPIQPV
jgi:hypothetical protein